MEQVEYPDIGSHANAHDNLIEMFNMLLYKKCRDDVAERKVVLMIVSNVLVEHIAICDSPLASYCQGMMLISASAA